MIWLLIIFSLIWIVAVMAFMFLSAAFSGMLQMLYCGVSMCLPALYVIGLCIYHLFGHSTSHPILTTVILAIFCVLIIPFGVIWFYGRTPTLTYDFQCGGKTLVVVATCKAQGAPGSHAWDFTFHYDGSDYFNAKDTIGNLQDQNEVQATHAIVLEGLDDHRAYHSYSLYGKDFKKNGKEFAACLLGVKEELINKIKADAPKFWPKLFEAHFGTLREEERPAALSEIRLKKISGQ